MREIRFRAWHIVKKTMLQVGDEYGTTDPLDCVMYARQAQPVILMQYTGLKDKNGKEIFEGDLLDFMGIATVEVVWRGCCWDYNVVKGAMRKPEPLFPMCVAVKVIGNIHENKNLLSLTNQGAG